MLNQGLKLDLCIAQLLVVLLDLAFKNKKN